MKGFRKKTGHVVELLVIENEHWVRFSCRAALPSKFKKGIKIQDATFPHLSGVVTPRNHPPLRCRAQKGLEGTRWCSRFELIYSLIRKKQSCLFDKQLTVKHHKKCRFELP